MFDLPHRFRALYASFHGKSAISLWPGRLGRLVHRTALPDSPSQKKVSYTAGVLSDLLACPFCRELFSKEETRTCPTCGLPLSPMSKLPLSYEAYLEEEWLEKPEWITLGWTYWRRGRGVLMGIGIAGFILFFLPWVKVISPESLTLSGTDLARALPWIWACPVAWLMLVTTAVSRRSVAKMRGARVATALFCAVPVVTIVVLILTPPTSRWIPIRFDYSWWMYATGLLGAMGLPFSVLFGGKLNNLPLPAGVVPPAIENKPVQEPSADG